MKKKRKRIKCYKNLKKKKLPPTSLCIKRTVKLNDHKNIW